MLRVTHFLPDAADVVVGSNLSVCISALSNRISTPGSMKCRAFPRVWRLHGVFTEIETPTLQ